jgi:hypothetical protein
MTPQLMQLIEETFEYGMTNVHTAFPAVVKSYDAETRRAEVQPSLKRKMSNGEFMDLPIIVDVPVLYFGTAKAGIHIPLEEGDEVLIVCSERCLDSWKDAGGDSIEDADTRRFSFPDAICIPGLQAQTFPNIKDKKGFSLHHDSKIVITTEKTTITVNEDKITFDNGKNKFELDDKIDFESTGTGTIKFGNSIATLGKILSDLLDDLAGMTTVGSPATHTVNPSDIAKFQQLKATVGQVFDS